MTVRQPARLMGNDLVVKEDACNLACTYCLTGQSNLKAGHRDQLIFQPPKVDSYDPATPLGQRLHRVVDRVQTTLRTPLLKVTGGEIFVIKGMIDFLEAVAPQHDVLVVQSNGLPLEIYAVLNDRSAPYVVDFAQWCGAFSDNRPQLFPFPVRGPDSDRFAMTADHIRHLEALRDLRPALPDVLPPQAYLDRLIDFFRNGRT